MNLLLLMQIILIIVLFIIIILIFREIFANNKAERIGYYSLNSIKKEELFFTEKISKSYFDFVKIFRKIIKKSKYLSKRAKQYDKYIKYKDRNIVLNIDYITSKIIISIVFLLLTIISQLFTGKFFGFFGYLFDVILGYYLFDFYLFFNYKRKTRNIENDLLRAVIIMNNAFKAGKSTLQALEIAGNELSYPLNDEFKKMYLDMKFGMSIDNVFDRFAKRLDLDEAIYLSSSLTILNKTGGNIIEVFSSIERTLYDRKKLDEEVKNISSGPKMVVKILCLVPVIFVLLIYILNPTYFNPLFESVLGYIIISIIVIMFIIYILLLKRILRIEG